MDRLLECIHNEEENYVLPFFWQHGECEDVLRTYMRAIHDANIREVCLEARPHPDYAGEGWFHDLDIILDEAKKLDMKIWILDDAHFPSGQCGGKLINESDELQKLYLKYRSVELAGPMSGVSIPVELMAKEFKNPFADKMAGNGNKKKWYADDQLFAVIATKMDGKNGKIHHLDENMIELTDLVKNGVVEWNVPNGNWKVFVLYTTRNNGGRHGYINLLSKKSCRKQVEYCYEPHYKRYKEEFGKTILGFFSDEPEIGNVEGYDACNSAIGNINMPIPWSREMEERIKVCFGESYRKEIIALWMPVGSEEYTANVRVSYMNLVTQLCKENFSEQIGTWCREHGVQYIGHIVEDNDQHVRLGASQGHFFRALWGQDWSGIDNINGQVTIGGANIAHGGFLGRYGDGEFYHQTLGKLGTSLADIDPKKKGRSMCEIFGAYGWREGTRLMKYEVDHFLVRGINHLVPHAFSPKEFPDSDCPPHFYAHGKNPLYKPFGRLMKYANRVCHLICGGKHEVKVAILYHAESEWAGMEFMDMVKPARVLNEHQIDFDFIPADVFTYQKEYRTVFDEKNGLKINEIVFQALIIPGTAYLSESVKQFVCEAKKSGFPVCFVDFAPKEMKDVAVISLEQIPKLIEDVGLIDVKTDIFFPDLQVYHYSQKKETYYLISNESGWEIFKGQVTLSVKGIPFVYDAMNNRIEKIPFKETIKGITLPLTIQPYEMKIVVVTESAAIYENLVENMPIIENKCIEVCGPWTLSFVENEYYPDFDGKRELKELVNIVKVVPDFSGIIRYENGFFIEDDSKSQFLELEEVYESAEVWVNNQYVGECICPPYRFNLSGFCKKGMNKLCIEVRTTLERKVNCITGGKNKYGLPPISPVYPQGMIGKVKILG